MGWPGAGYNALGRHGVFLLTTIPCSSRSPAPAHRSQVHARGKAPLHIGRSGQRKQQRHRQPWQPFRLTSTSRRAKSTLPTATGNSALVFDRRPALKGLGAYGKPQRDSCRRLSVELPAAFGNPVHGGGAEGQPSTSASIHAASDLPERRRLFEASSEGDRRTVLSRSSRSLETRQRFITWWCVNNESVSSSAPRHHGRAHRAPRRTLPVPRRAHIAVVSRATLNAEVTRAARAKIPDWIRKLTQRPAERSRRPAQPAPQGQVIAPSPIAYN